MTSLTLTLIRGLPGSGKSTLAKSLDGYHLETDMYFTDKQGRYQFDGEFLREAHLWCQQQCELKLSQGVSVIVSNTFVKQWEMDAYRLLAKKYHAKLIIKTCTGKFNNQHDVPQQTLQKMQREWQP
ncbi:MAG: ATP-binding protein [Psychromonas sp.]